MGEPVCAVADCNTSRKANYDVSFHCIPKNSSVRKQWTKFLGHSNITSKTFFCSQHFTEDCFTNWHQKKMGFATKLSLKPDAVPSIKTPSSGQPEASLSSLQPAFPAKVNVATQTTVMRVSIGTQSGYSCFQRNACTQWSYKMLQKQVKTIGTQTKGVSVSAGTQVNPSVEARETVLGVRPAKRRHLDREEEEIKEEESATDIQQARNSMYLQDLPRNVSPADVQQMMNDEEKLSLEQQETGPTLNQTDSEPPQIKEEQESVLCSHQGEQLQGVEEADTTKVFSIDVVVKSEEEEELQSSQFNQRPAGLMETDTDEDACGEPARDPYPERILEQHMRVKTEDTSETDDSDDWRVAKEHHSGCSEGGKTFRKKRNVKRHTRIHQGEKLYRCHNCQDDDLRRHQCVKDHGSEHAKNEAANENDCVGPETSRGSSQERLVQPDTEDKTDDSDGWEKTTEHQSSLNSEKKSDNGTPKKSHSCSFCGKILTKKWHLTQHMRTHTGEKPFGCSVCGKRFYQQGHLISHMLIHSGDKPFGCSECGKRFTQKYYLTLHMAHHRGEKLLSCSTCDQRFSWYSQLKNHKCAGGQASEFYQNQTDETGMEHDGEDPDKHLPPETKDSSELETDDEV
ncbi:zinc finger protein 436-like [Xyrichtys novacula]|nr:zinc finger protein 436-like [Xyrichtys novacula]